MPNLEARVRDQIKDFLPAALTRALSAYKHFSSQKAENKDDPVDFKKHQEACKVAVAHIQLLIKLAKMVREFEPETNPQQNETNEQDMLQTLIENAQAELKIHT